MRILEENDTLSLIIILLGLIVILIVLILLFSLFISFVLRAETLELKLISSRLLLVSI